MTERNISQFLDGSFGRLSIQDGGMPVYLSIVLIPDFLTGVTEAGAGAEAEVVMTKINRTENIERTTPGPVSAYFPLAAQFLTRPWLKV